MDKLDFHWLHVLQKVNHRAVVLMHSIFTYLSTKQEKVVQETNLPKRQIAHVNEFYHQVLISTLFLN